MILINSLKCLLFNPEIKLLSTKRWGWWWCWGGGLKSTIALSSFWGEDWIWSWSSITTSSSIIGGKSKSWCIAKHTINQINNTYLGFSGKSEERNYESANLWGGRREGKIGEVVVHSVNLLPLHPRRGTIVSRHGFLLTKRRTKLLFLKFLAES